MTKLFSPPPYEDGLGRMPEEERPVAALEERRYRRVSRLGMVPLDAPHMPLPGPGFMRVATLCGDGSRVVKKYRGGKKPVPRSGELLARNYEVALSVGDVLNGLYLRALRDPDFRMEVEVKKGVLRAAAWVPGHIWGEGFDSYKESHLGNTPRAAVSGPAPAEVMVIGKMPWHDEVEAGRNFVGPTGAALVGALRAAHIKGIKDWYVTNLVKFMPPGDSTTLRAEWVKDCLPLLAQELRIVRPRFILCLGADASRALLSPKSRMGVVEKGVSQFGVGAMEGRVVKFRYCAEQGYPAEGEEPEWLEADVMTVVHPVMVARDESVGRQLERGLQRFALVLSGADFRKEEEGLDHRVCTTLEEAEELLEEVAADLEVGGTNMVAWDAEWHGQHPVNAGSYMRTVQMSWKPKSAVCFLLRRAGGEPAFVDRFGKPAGQRLMAMLTDFMRGRRAVGHFLVSDMEWFVHEGLDLRDAFAVPLHAAENGDPAWLRCQKGEGGFDTAMACHAVEETAMLGLESLTLRYTTAPRYDAPLEEWKTEYCKERKIKKAALEGYGDCPDSVLVPYSLYDADVTLRIAHELLGLLDRDYFGQNAWEAFWESMIIQPVILEIHQTGIPVYRRRLDELTDKFVDAAARLEAEVRAATNWGDAPKQRFNIRSVQHVKEYLFGEALNGRLTPEGQSPRIRRPEGVSLGIRPLLTTSKPPLRWEDVEAKGLESEYSPSTAKGVLALLAQDNPEHAREINRIRDYRFIDQVLKSILRPPCKDASGMYLIEDDNGDRVYAAGLATSIDDDGCVRPHMYPTAETGRWKCSRPNLQNVSKARDPDYERLLGVDAAGQSLYDHKLRSVLCSPSAAVLQFRRELAELPARKRRTLAERHRRVFGLDDRTIRALVRDPFGCWVDGQDEVFVDFDYKGAELYGMAIMSNDQLMIEHAKRNIMFDDEGYDANGKKAPGGKFPHPQWFDIHSNVAVMAFRLTVPDGVISDAKLAGKFGLPVGTSYAEALKRRVGDELPASKTALAMIGKAHLRIVAKSVIFGVAYGRAAKAIALAVREQGVNISVEEAQQVIDALFGLYTELRPFFDSCRERALSERWLCSCYGRFRRFPNAGDDFKLAGDFERQAMNFPIQSAIASCLDRGVAELYALRQRMAKEYGEVPFRFALTIHDAVLLRVKAAYVHRLIKGGLIEWAMCKAHPIYPTGLDGLPKEGGPYHLGLDFEVSEYWSEPISVQRCVELGVPTEFGK